MTRPATPAMTEQRRITKGDAGKLGGTTGHRPYRLGRRQAAVDATRTRILNAASDLHREIGPKATTASAVAHRAGVTRATLYRHFATQSDLRAATASDWATLHPRPKFAAWATIGDPAARLRAGLSELYAWYGSTAPAIGTFLRDKAPDSLGTTDLPDPARQARNVLLPGWPSAAAAPMLRPSLRLATAFETWRSLKNENVADDEMVELMVRFVRIAMVSGSRTLATVKPRKKPDVASKSKAAGKRRPDRKQDRKRKGARRGRS
jgi:AcrR family transcriptional regulator